MTITRSPDGTLEKGISLSAPDWAMLRVLAKDKISTLRKAASTLRDCAERFDAEENTAAAVKAEALADEIEAFQNRILTKLGLPA